MEARLTLCDRQMVEWNICVYCLPTYSHDKEIHMGLYMCHSSIHELYCLNDVHYQSDKCKQLYVVIIKTVPERVLPVIYSHDFINGILTKNERTRHLITGHLLHCSIYRSAQRDFVPRS